MTHPHAGPPETSSNKEGPDTAIQGNTTTQSDLGTTRTRIYHSTDTTEEWQQHNYNIVNTHKTVMELASHIQITGKISNITTPTRKHTDTQHNRRRSHPRGSTPPKAYTETWRNTPTPRAQVCCSKLYTPHCRVTSLGNKLK